MAFAVSKHILFARELNEFTPCRERRLFDRMVELLGIILDTTHKKLTKNNHLKIVKALRYSAQLHRRQYRQLEVEPYMLHLLEVTCILIGVGAMSYELLCAAILHDTVELLQEASREAEEKKMKRRLKEIRTLFGHAVRDNVDVVTERDEETNDQYCARMLSHVQVPALASTQRLITALFAILIKMADRTHNMRTLNCMPNAKQKNKLNETRLWYPQFYEKANQLIHELAKRRVVSEKSYLSYSSLLYLQLRSAMAAHE